MQQLVVWLGERSCSCWLFDKHLEFTYRIALVRSSPLTRGVRRAEAGGAAGRALLQPPQPGGVRRRCRAQQDAELLALHVHLQRLRRRAWVRPATNSRDVKAM